MFLSTLFLQNVRELSAMHAGIDILPMAIMAMLLPPFSGRIVGRRNSRGPLVVAETMLLASSLMLVRLSSTTSFTWLFLSDVFFCVGFGLVNAPIATAAVSGMPRDRAGVAAGIASTSRARSARHRRSIPRHLDKRPHSARVARNAPPSKHGGR